MTDFRFRELALNLASTNTASSTTVEKAGFIARFVQAYRKFHDKRPYTTQVIQAFFVSAIGDAISQNLFSEDDYSFARTLKVMSIGGFLSMPTHTWFMFMSRNINHRIAIVSLLMKVTANQTCFAPFFISTFVTIGSLSRGVSDPEELLGIIKERVPVAWMNGCMFWPNIVILNFTLIPPYFRGLVNSCASIVWQTYLSWLTFSSKKAVNEATVRELELERRVQHLDICLHMLVKSIAINAQKLFFRGS
ncbi:hypothetical protein V1511DRAFT_521935 [Dipodascopsis uninucleata]